MQVVENKSPGQDVFNPTLFSCRDTLNDTFLCQFLSIPLFILDYLSNENISDEKQFVETCMHQ